MGGHPTGHSDAPYRRERSKSLHPFLGTCENSALGVYATVLRGEGWVLRGEGWPTSRVLEAQELD